jgi:hypothetical protein
MLGSRFHFLRLAVCAVLTVGYLSLMGEAIHCQYVMDDHATDHHNHKSSPAPDTHPHCLSAGHCAVAAIHAAVLSPLHPLQLVGLLSASDQPFLGSSFTESGSARAPPA